MHRRHLFTLLSVVMLVASSITSTSAKWPSNWRDVVPDMPYEVPEPTTGRLDCWGFPNQADAQAVLVALPHDPFGLDPDFNGIACDHDPLLVAYQNGYPLFVAAWEPESYPPDDSRDYEFFRASQDYYGLKVEYVTNPNRARTTGVYLIGVNVPPMANPASGSPDSCLAGAAETFATEQLNAAGTVTVEWDEDVRFPNNDPVGYIWYQNSGGGKVLLQEEILRQGLAVYSGIEHLDRYADRLKAAQGEAIDQRTGLWGIC